MSAFTRVMEEKIMPVAGKIAGQRHLSALRDGIILTMPLIIIGSVFLILTSLPIPGYADFMASVFGNEWADKLGYPVNASFDIMAMIAAFGIAWQKAMVSMPFLPERFQLPHFCWQHRLRCRLHRMAQRNPSW